MTRQATIRIPEMYRGPPRSGNGGYVSGLVAELLADSAQPGLPGRAVEVTLRAPVPLDRDLTVLACEDELRVADGEQLIVEARTTTLELVVPPAPSWDEAFAVRADSPSLRRGPHPLLSGEHIGVHPICFCCGAELEPERGLHVYAAAVPGRAQVAAAWTCHAAFAADSGELPAAIVWAALDCPGQHAWLAEGVRTGMLGRITGRIERRARAGEPYLVTGWTLGSEGRKYYAGTALHDRDGLVYAYAKAVWIGWR